MLILPAIDLRNGQVVRLRQGDPAQQTVFATDPVAVARQWEAEGAPWLHVINLDGALGDKADANVQALAAILAAVSIPVQFGGGVRTAEDVARLLAQGVARVILGTAALENPGLVSQAVETHGAEHIAVSLDARGGFLAARGWQAQTQLPVTEWAQALRARGLTRVVYTDIARDGMLTGVDAAGCAALAREADLYVIASGGAAGLADLQALKAYGDPRLDGLILGQALYTGAVGLREAIAASAS